MQSAVPDIPPLSQEQRSFAEGPAAPLAGPFAFAGLLASSYGLSDSSTNWSVGHQVGQLSLSRSRARFGNRCRRQGRSPGRPTFDPALEAEASPSCFGNQWQDHHDGNDC